MKVNAVWKIRNTSPKKESFFEWQERIIDRIEAILSSQISKKDYKDHYNNFTTWKQIKKVSEYWLTLNPEIEKCRKNLKEIVLGNIENNHLYNIPLLVIYLYKQMWNKASKLIIALAKYYNHIKQEKLFDIDWSKYSKRLPKNFIEFCDNRNDIEWYEKYTLWIQYLVRFTKYKKNEKRKNLSANHDFATILENSSMYRSRAELNLESLENMEEVEFIRYLVWNTLDSIPSMLEVSYEWWIKYLIEWIEKEISKNQKDIDYYNKHLDKDNKALITISRLLNHLINYIQWNNNSSFKRIKTSIESNRWKDKLSQDEIVELKANYVVLLKAYESNSYYKNKIKNFFDKLDIEEYKNLLEIKLLMNFSDERIERSRKKLSALEKKKNHLENSLKSDIEKLHNKAKNYQRQTLSKAIKSDYYKKEFEIKKQNKDFRSLDFLEDQAIIQVMSVVAKFHKESSDDNLRDNIPKNFLKNKNFTCFSGVWLLAWLLLDMWFKEKDIYVSFWYQSGNNYNYRHAYLLVRKSNWRFLRVDYGFSKIEKSNFPATDDFLQNAATKQLDAWYNGTSVMADISNLVWIDKLSLLYKLKDGLLLWYLINYAWILFQKKDYKSCEKILRLASSIDPFNTDINEMFMLLYDARWHINKARDMALGIRKQAQNIISVYYIMWKYNYKKWYYSKAKMFFEKFDRLESKSRKVEKNMKLYVSNKLKEITDNKLDTKIDKDILNRHIDLLKQSSSVTMNYSNLNIIHRKTIISIVKEDYEKEENISHKILLLNTLSRILEYERENMTKIWKELTIDLV